ncbi:hypothetical protein SPURM210S_05679 [Streptomyces purpurascens]
MNGTTLHKTAADCAEELPGAQLEHPFGDVWEVFKVRGKVFMLMTRRFGTPRRDPQGGPRRGPRPAGAVQPHHPRLPHEQAARLTLEGGDDVDKELVDELVTDSYRLVVAHLPKAERPVDPHTYGSRMRAAR